MLKNYLKITWKVLLRNKFFTFISLFGISVTLMILMIVTALIDHITGPKVPELNIARMLFISEVRLSGDIDGQKYSRTSGPSFDFLDRRIKPLKTPEAITVFSRSFRKQVSYEQRMFKYSVKYTDDQFWNVYDFNFLWGRGFNKKELDNSDRVAVVSRKLTANNLRAGETTKQYITLDAIRYRIIGIVEDVSRIENTAFAHIWIPLTLDPYKTNRLGFLGDYQASILARSSNDFPAIRSELKQILNNFQSPDPKRFDAITCFLETKEEAGARMFLGIEPGEQSGGLIYLVLGGLMIMFMILPVINLISINTCRIAERSSEIGIRKAFGASRLTLTGQFLIENIILTLVGGGIGFMSAYVVLDILTDSGVIPYATFHINVSVLICGMLLTLLFGFLSGVLPAIKMSRLEPVRALKGGDR